jgi:hypothetical protein
LRTTQGLNCLFNAGGYRVWQQEGGNLNVLTQVRWVHSHLNQNLSPPRKPIRESKVKRETERKKMAGNFGSRDRGERGNVGAFGPYHCDCGTVGAGRSWGGWDSWSWRGGAPHGDFRGARPGRSGGFGRGRDGQFPPPAGWRWQRRLWEAGTW